MTSMRRGTCSSLESAILSTGPYVCLTSSPSKLRELGLALRLALRPSRRGSRRFRWHWLTGGYYDADVLSDCDPQSPRHTEHDLSHLLLTDYGRANFSSIVRLGERRRI